MKIQKRPPEQARKEAVAFVFHESRTTSQAKNKAAIIAMFQKLLKND
jgi:hypothetical protein